MSFFLLLLLQCVLRAQRKLELGSEKDTTGASTVGVVITVRYITTDLKPATSDGGRIW